MNKTRRFSLRLMIYPCALVLLLAVALTLRGKGKRRT